MVVVPSETRACCLSARGVAEDDSDATSVIFTAVSESVYADRGHKLGKMEEAWCAGSQSYMYALWWYIGQSGETGVI